MLVINYVCVEGGGVEGGGGVKTGGGGVGCQVRFYPYKKERGWKRF